MQEKSDTELLRDYAEHANEAAFREIVQRHAGLVYASARRQVMSPDLARDVAQSIFTDLARKAPALASTLTEPSSLLGWLYRSTRFTALNLLRDDRRRLARERQVMEHFDPAATTAPDWDQVQPVLDAAMAELPEEDRDALLLRFFKNRDFRSIGATLGISDDAAQKRVSRALERLRGQLTHRGVTTTAIALSTALSVNAIPLAPAGLAATLAAGALTGATLATTATVTATKAIAMTTLQKTLITATLAVLAGVGIYEARQASQLREQVQTLHQWQATLVERVQQLQHERDETTNRLSALGEDNVRLHQNTAELLRLRARITSLLQSNQDLTALANNSATSNSILVDEKDYAIPDSWANAGLETPTAAIRTYLWAMSNTNIAKLKEVFSPPTRTREAFFDSLGKQGWTMNSGIKGARILQGNRIGDNENECLFEIQIMEESPATTESGEPLGLLKTMDKHSIILRRTDGVWRVAATGQRELSPEEIAELDAAKKEY